MTCWCEASRTSEELIEIRCCACKRPVAAGVEAAKMVVEYRQADGSSKLFGLAAPGGPLTGATGQILRGWHSRCFHVVRKREARNGSILNGAPTSYEIAGMVLTKDDLDALGLSEDEAQQRSTAFLTDRMSRLRRIAHEVGKAVGDPGVVEAFRAAEHGGPYAHSHDLPVEPYQIREHLCYAHGYDSTADPSPQATHQRFHTAYQVSQIQAMRAQDPGHTEPEQTDWRQQLAVDIEHITGGNE